jgi:hypothetical protein
MNMTSNFSSISHRAAHVTRKRLLIGFATLFSAFTVQAASSVKMTLPMEAPKDYFREQCFTLELGNKLTYKVSTPHPIEFNLHHHRNDGQTVYPEKLVVKSQLSRQLVAESAGVYCFMATNVADQSGPFNVVLNYEITAK